MSISPPSFVLKHYLAGELPAGFIPALLDSMESYGFPHSGTLHWRIGTGTEELDLAKSDEQRSRLTRLLQTIQEEWREQGSRRIARQNLMFSFSGPPRQHQTPAPEFTIGFSFPPECSDQYTRICCSFPSEVFGPYLASCHRDRPDPLLTAVIEDVAKIVWRSLGGSPVFCWGGFSFDGNEFEQEKRIVQFLNDPAGAFFYQNINIYGAPVVAKMGEDNLLSILDTLPEDKAKRRLEHIDGALFYLPEPLEGKEERP